jgi:hypothetical protein
MTAVAPHPIPAATTAAIGEERSAQDETEYRILLADGFFEPEPRTGDPDHL